MQGAQLQQMSLADMPTSVCSSVWLPVCSSVQIYGQTYACVLPRLGTMYALTFTILAGLASRVCLDRSRQACQAGSSLSHGS